ncbi:hypothetical protein GCM10022222_09990 [Amycolatopsis ultiminotia]|uniref:Uncharacterized protein n=1 Tax=Amycolatopsis ultiminotia TaxID=543629 RepID=A0ABP6V8N8_9PSEU
MLRKSNPGDALVAGIQAAIRLVHEALFGVEWNRTSGWASGCVWTSGGDVGGQVVQDDLDRFARVVFGRFLQEGREVCAAADG